MKYSLCSIPSTAGRRKPPHHCMACYLSYFYPTSMPLCIPLPALFAVNNLVCLFLLPLLTVSAMQPTYNFQVPKALLPLAFAKAELALGSAVQLAEQCKELFMVQPLLTAIDVAPTAAAGGQSRGPGWLALTFVEADKQLKVKVQLCLDGLLARQAGVQLCCCFADLQLYNGVLAIVWFAFPLCNI